MTDQEILKILEDTQAIKKGHFVLTSGRHSDTYIQCARVLENPSLSYELAKEAAARIPQEIKERLTLVASPAVGGMLFGFALAHVLGLNFIFSERVEGKMKFRRSFEVAQNDCVLVAEDVVTTGGSVQEVCELVEQAGAELACVVSLIDRKTDKKFKASFYPLLELPTASWDPADCELCKNNVEFESLGSRRLAK